MLNALGPDRLGGAPHRAAPIFNGSGESRIGETDAGEVRLNCKLTARGETRSDKSIVPLGAFVMQPCVEDTQCIVEGTPSLTEGTRIVLLAKPRDSTALAS